MIEAIFLKNHNRKRSHTGLDEFNKLASLRAADVSHRSSPLRNVSGGGPSTTQREKFHIDDAKYVRNPVRSANWSTE